MLELSAALAMGSIFGALIALIVQVSRLPDSVQRLTDAIDICLVGRRDETARNAQRRLQEFRSDYGPILRVIDAARRLLRCR